MNYTETLNFLFAQLPMYQRDGKAAYKANLDNTLALDSYFGHPHRKFMTVHVAGTNGKGSSSHMVASVLQAAGYKTGLYTSPHLRDFRERIRVNGEPIPESKVVDFVELHQGMIKKIQPSFFEMTVALAFNHFKEEAVDVAVIETGMGGRLDSTNIVQPLVSVITNIGLDHTQFLGNTLKAIAAEKAGIIKSKVPVVVGETQMETKPVFDAKAKEKNTEIAYADQRFIIRSSSFDASHQLIEVEDNKQSLSGDYRLDLKGSYQLKNALTALSTLSALQSTLKIDSNHILEGLANVAKHTGLKGRWQVMQMQPKVICDTGHNKEGMDYILNQLEQEQYNTLHMVFGMVDDKDVLTVLKRLPKTAKYYFTQASIPRALGLDKLMSAADEAGLQGEGYANVPLAIEAAKKQASAKDLIFIGGSTFVVADIPDL